MKQRPHRLALLALAALALCPAEGAIGSSGTPSRERRPVVVEVRRGGFHWGDAAIGAAAGCGLALAAGGLVLLTRSARTVNPSQERSNQ